METLVIIKRQFPLVERPYQDRQTGEQKMFASRGMVLQVGLDTVYAEAVGDVARQLPQDMGEGSAWWMHLQMTVRTYQDSQGMERVANQIEVRRAVL